MRMAVILMMMALGIRLRHGGPADSADLILTGGHILTQSETIYPTPPTAVAVAGRQHPGRGTDEQVLEAKGPDTRVVDLDGATVIPGFIDSHCHLYGLGKSLAQIDLMGTESPPQIAGNGPGRRGQVRRRRLDRGPRLGPERLGGPGVPDPPDAGRRSSPTARSSCAASTATPPGPTAKPSSWRASPPTRPTPQAGEILRDADGEPTGILIDNAVDLVVDVIPDVGAGRDPAPHQAGGRTLPGPRADRRARGGCRLGAGPGLPRHGRRGRTGPARLRHVRRRPRDPRPGLAEGPVVHR